MSDLESRALAVACKECGKPQGEWCVYTAPKGDPERAYTRSAKFQARVALTGTRTKRLHNSRFSTVWERERRDMLRDMYATTATPVRSEIRAAARAMVEFDRQEYEALRRWFARYGDVLTG